MITVPLAAAGAIVSLVATQTHFSISAGVGFIALFGVCIQNGVILVSKIRELIAEGMPQHEAVIAGAVIRMRPVLIATLVALAGLVPAALSNGIGSQSQKPFAIVIVGGILPATILTLMVLPALYGWFDRGRPAAAALRPKRRSQTDPDAEGQDETQGDPDESSTAEIV
jgi:cobalt-zinc-cadmium resistance protein CzcA